MKGVQIMPNVEKVLKGEIARISRKEVQFAIGGIEKSNRNLRKSVVDLKKRVASLEKENKQLIAETRRPQVESVKEHSENGGRARFTSKGIRSLRSRLRLSQADFAKLAGATTHAVYLWEKKQGPLNLRDKTKESILSIRGLGAKEARMKLDEL
jgi:DNA-binding transcriptional regulator YiaG